MPDKFIETCFPACADDGYTETSPATYEYNCIAWAAGVTDIPWWPIRSSGVFWPLHPQKFPRRSRLSRIPQSLSGKLSATRNVITASLEPGICEKIALYQSNNGSPTHAAKPIARWKMDQQIGSFYKDITHATPAALETSDAPVKPPMAIVVTFMRAHEPDNPIHGCRGLRV